MVMKHPVRQFKSLAVALKELEPFIRDGRLIRSGRPLAKFGNMLPREAIANLMVCLCIKGVDGKDLTFVSDPIGVDGVVWERSSETAWPTEHVMAGGPRSGKRPADRTILDAIAQKNQKGGGAYASGKTLIVFADAASGAWCPNRVARQLPDPLHFDAVWVVALQRVKDGEYAYAVTRLDVSGGDAPTMMVRINRDFSSWTVERLQ